MITKHIPNLDELEDNLVSNQKLMYAQVMFYGYKTENLTCVVSDIHPQDPKKVFRLTEKDELYHEILRYRNAPDDGSIFHIARDSISIVGDRVFSYSFYTGQNKNNNNWSFIDKFEVKNELNIGDPCYFKYLGQRKKDLIYSEKVNGVFYAFCNIDENGTLTDVLVMNEKCYLDRHFNFEFKRIKELGVDAGCIVFNDWKEFFGSENEEFDKWYDKYIISMCNTVGYPIENGICVQSGYGDGCYDLMKAEDNSKGYLAFHINFI